MLKTKPVAEMNETERAAHHAAQEAAEAAVVATLSDAEVLARAAHFGPGIIGHALFRRAQELRFASDNGRLGPAITDPDYAAKQEAKRAAALADAEELEPDDDDDVDGEERGEPAAPVDPWSFVTLSGAKMLAQQHGISYVPRIKKVDLIDLLKAAGIEPPAPPDDDEDDDED